MRDMVVVASLFANDGLDLEISSLIWASVQKE